MSTTFDFAALVSLCRQTHTQLQGEVARVANTALAARNWLFGWYIVEYEQNGADRAEYGRRLMERLASTLVEVDIPGTSPTNLRKFREFYRAYRGIAQTLFVEFAAGAPTDEHEIQQTASVESLTALLASPQIRAAVAPIAGCFRLGWSHYVELLTIDDPEERRFYEIEAQQNGWGVRELKRQIASSLFERLALSRDKDEVRRLAQEGQVVEKPADLIKTPLVLEFLELEESPAYSEDELEAAIINKIESFLLELGKGFLFEARQKRFTFDDEHFYVDLVFYNRLLRCYVLIDLKRGKLTHQDLGQMQMYVNYFDRHVKIKEELPTIGILLCHRKNDALVELTLPPDANIFAPKYQLYLPSKEELKQQLQLAQAELEAAE